MICVIRRVIGFILVSASLFLFHTPAMLAQDLQFCTDQLDRTQETRRDHCLEGINTFGVIVNPLPELAKNIGITREDIYVYIDKLLIENNIPITDNVSQVDLLPKIYITVELIQTGQSYIGATIIGIYENVLLYRKRSRIKEFRAEGIIWQNYSIFSFSGRPADRIMNLIRKHIDELSRQYHLVNRPAQD